MLLAAAPREYKRKDPARVTPSIHLKRFLYLTYEHQKYITGDPSKHDHFTRENVLCVNEFLLADNVDTLISIIEIANADKDLPHRGSLFIVLALAATTTVITTPEVRSKIYQAVLRISEDDKDFFLFLKFISVLNKTISTGINKMIAAYFKRKDYRQFAEDIGSGKSYYGWTHGDLFKISHFKANDIVLDSIIKYVLFGAQKAKDFANNNEEACELIKYLEKTNQFRRSVDEEEALMLLNSLPNFGFQQIPTNMNKSSKLWFSLVDNMPLGEILTFLPRLYNAGQLKNDNPCQAKIVEIITNPELIKESKIHPIEVFIALKNFEKGGKPKDPKLIKYLEAAAVERLKLKPTYVKPNFAQVDAFKCPNILSALNKTLMHSYDNLCTNGFKYLITVEISDDFNKSHCITTKNVLCIEAAVILAISLIKEGKYVIVAVFNGNTITPVTFEKVGSVAQCVKNLTDATHGDVKATSPIEWAKSKKKVFNCFINITYNPEKKISETADNLEKYKSAVNISNSKLIRYIMGTTGILNNFEYASILDIRGFDKTVPKIIDAYLKSKF